MGIRIHRVTRDAAQRVSRIAEPACGLVRNDRVLGETRRFQGHLCVHPARFAMTGFMGGVSIDRGDELDSPILNVWNVWV